MMLYFLRHADAEPDYANDFNRRLTPKGVEQADKVGKFCARNGLIPDLILSSPVIRARQTADAVSLRLGEVEIVESPWIACGLTPSTLLAELAAYTKFTSLFIVGHEPDFSECIGHLTGVRMNVRKASLTLLDLPRLREGGGELQFSVPVRLM